MVADFDQQYQFVFCYRLVLTIVVITFFGVKKSIQFENEVFDFIRTPGHSGKLRNWFGLSFKFYLVFDCYLVEFFFEC